MTRSTCLGVQSFFFFVLRGRVKLKRTHVLLAKPRDECNLRTSIPEFAFFFLLLFLLLLLFLPAAKVAEPWDIRAGSNLHKLGRKPLHSREVSAV